MKSTLLTIALLLSAPVVIAQKDTRSPALAYHGDVMGGMKLCELKYQLAVMKQSSGEETKPEEDPIACISDLQDTGKKAYARAMRSVRKPAAQAMLKNFHAMWVPAVRGISPHANELQINYQRRRAETWDRLGEAWTRFELENE